MTNKADINQWARLGAAARLKELQEELAAIYKAFPDLKGSRGVTVSASGAPKKRFSAAGKAAISEGMRKYWARRKAKAAKAAAGK